MAQARFTAGRILSRRQPDPGRQLSAVFEILAIAHRSNHGIRRNRPDPGHLLNTPTALILTSMFNDVLLTDSHPRLCLAPLCVQHIQRIKQAGWHRRTRVGIIKLALQGGVTLRQHHAELGQQAMNTIADLPTPEPSIPRVRGATLIAPADLHS